MRSMWSMILVVFIQFQEHRICFHNSGGSRLFSIYLFESGMSCNNHPMTHTAFHNQRTFSVFNAFSQGIDRNLQLFQRCLRIFMAFKLIQRLGGNDLLYFSKILVDLCIIENEYRVSISSYDLPFVL